MRRQGIFPGRNVRDKYFPGKGSYDSLPIWPSNIWLIATPLLKHPPYSWNNVLSFVFLRTESLSSSVPYLNFITKKNPIFAFFHRSFCVIRQKEVYEYQSLQECPNYVLGDMPRLHQRDMKSHVLEKSASTYHTTVFLGSTESNNLWWFRSSLAGWAWTIPIKLSLNCDFGNGRFQVDPKVL